VSLARVDAWRAEGPAGFAADALGAQPTEQQWEASRALVAGRRVSIRSGHGCGKTAFMSWAVLWFMCTRFPAKVGCTAPSSAQIDVALWPELALWHRRLCERMPPLGAEFAWNKSTFEMISAPQESFAVARTSRPEQPEALQGLHSENVLFLLDEASGIPDGVFQPVEGSLSTPGAYVLMAGNPTRMAGYFYDSHHSLRDHWAALHWDGEESPLVSREFIDHERAVYGADSAVYRIRVKGEFAGSLDGVIPLELIESAYARDVRVFGPIRWGLDVARFGDDRTALCKRHGNALLEPVQTWRGRDTMQVAGLVVNEYADAEKKPEAICVDVIGLGAGVVDRLAEEGLPVVGVNVAESPAVTQHYARLRDELWFEARAWFEGRDVRMCRDEALVAELTAPNFKLLSTGKKQVEPKDETKKRISRSPDIADAFVLTFARGIASHRGALKYPAMSYA